MIEHVFTCSRCKAKKTIRAVPLASVGSGSFNLPKGWGWHMGYASESALMEALFCGDCEQEHQDFDTPPIIEFMEKK